MSGNVYEVFFTRFAEDDLGEILDFYLTKNRPFAVKLLETVEARVSELSSYPERGRVIPELERKSIVDYREIVEGNYRILYKVEDRKVFVLAIVDGRRNFEEVVIAKLMRLV